MEINIEERVAKARQLFKSGYNCSQSVFLTYADYFQINPTFAATLSAPLGGGMGRLREVCGAVSGMFLVAGLKYPFNNPQDKDAKKLNYTVVQELANRFREENGAIVCRELLQLDHKKDSPIPEERTESYYKRRPCEEYVASAARIVGEKISQM